MSRSPSGPVAPPALSLIITVETSALQFGRASVRSSWWSPVFLLAEVCLSQRIEMMMMKKMMKIWGRETRFSSRVKLATVGSFLTIVTCWCWNDLRLVIYYVRSDSLPHSDARAEGKHHLITQYVWCKCLRFMFVPILHRSSRGRPWSGLHDFSPNTAEKTDVNPCDDARARLLMTICSSFSLSCLHWGPLRVPLFTGEGNITNVLDHVKLLEFIRSGWMCSLSVCSEWWSFCWKESVLFPLTFINIPVHHSSNIMIRYVWLFFERSTTKQAFTFKETLDEHPTEKKNLNDV